MRIFHKLIVLAAAAAAVISCTKQAPDTEAYADASFTVSTGTLTRATIDNDGKAAGVTRFICEVYYEGELYIRKVNTVAAGTLQTTFTTHLLRSHDYEVLFWADCGNGEKDLYFNTTKGLKAITLASKTVGNDDKMDAFFAKDVIVNLSDTYSKGIVLTRPFAQLNVITDDIDDIRESMIASKMEPDQTSLSVKAPASFNVSTGKAGEPETISYTANVYYKVSGKNASPLYTLAMCYLFADEAGSVNDVDFKALNAGVELTSAKFVNIPIKRNYRTNISGSILTNASAWTVEIDPGWETPENDIK